MTYASGRRDAVWSALRALLAAEPTESLAEASARVVRARWGPRGAQAAAIVIDAAGPLTGEAAWAMLERALIAATLHVFERDDGGWSVGEIAGGTKENPSLANIRPIVLRPPFNAGRK